MTPAQMKKIMLIAVVCMVTIAVVNRVPQIRNLVYQTA